MPNAEDEIRSALRLLEPRVADFEARLREAAATHVPGDPLLESLREQVRMLREERQRLREQLRDLKDG